MDEKPVIQPTYIEPDLTVPSEDARLEHLFGNFPQVTTTPTWSPRTFRESIAVDTSTNKLYYYDFTNLAWKSVNLFSYTQGMFGGDGSDGALSLTSGNTNLDLGGAAVVVKNYTTISITGTGVLTGTNAHANGTKLILKSQGAVTLTSSATRLIDLRGCGADGGAGGATNGVDGADGSLGAGVIAVAANGVKGVGSTGGAAGGAAGAAYTNTGIYKRQNDQSHSIILACGSGGAGGGAGLSATGAGAGTFGSGGAGGDGGGVLIIECGGALNFTGTIDVSGSAGTAGNSATGQSSGGGGGGGAGSAGMCVILYNTLTANSGTITDGGAAGGAGGNGTNGLAGGTNGGGGGGGGGAGSIAGTGGAGGAGSPSTNGTNGTGVGSTASAGGGGGGGGGGVIHAVNPGGTGGTGGAGGGNYGTNLLVIKNTEF